MPTIKITFEDLKHRHKTPLSYCRQLIKEGVYPSTRLEIYREQDEWDLAIKSIGAGSKLTVVEDNKGAPRLTAYRPYSVDRSLKVCA